MNCKFNKNCLKGQVWEEGVFKGRCECMREKFINFYYDWSSSPVRNKKFIEELSKDKEIYLDGDEEKQVELTEEIKFLSEIYIKLINESMKNNRPISDKILLQGTPGSGKTQFAITLALEILKDMDLTRSEMIYKPFYFLSLEKIISESKVYDDNFKEQLWKKINYSKVLIIDDLGEELEKLKKTNGQEDKRVLEVLDILKQITEEFNGLLIMTTNIPNFEKMYEKVKPRLHSRLFGKEGENDNLLFYAVVGEDKRDEQKSEAIMSIKNRFKK